MKQYDLIVPSPEPAQHQRDCMNAIKASCPFSMAYGIQTSFNSSAMKRRQSISTYFSTTYREEASGA